MSHKQRWKTNEHNFLFLFILLRILFFPIPSFFYIFNSAFSDKAFLSNWNKSIIYLFKKFSENYIFLHWLCFQREKIQESWIFWCWEIKKESTLWQIHDFTQSPFIFQSSNSTSDVCSRYSSAPVNPSPFSFRSFLTRPILIHNLIHSLYYKKSTQVYWSTKNYLENPNCYPFFSFWLPFLRFPISFVIISEPRDNWIIWTLLS